MFERMKILVCLLLSVLTGVFFYCLVWRKKRIEEIKEEVMDFDFIKQFETGSTEPILTVFRNQIDGNLEVGFGHVLPNVGWKVGDKITRKKAEELFQQDIDKAIAVYGDSLNWDSFTVNQKRAIISHAYNTGARSGTIIKYANSGKWNELASWFPNHYITSNGQTLNGLIRRRTYEASLLLS